MEQTLVILYLNTAQSSRITGPLLQYNVACLCFFSSCIKLRIVTCLLLLSLFTTLVDKGE